MSELVESEGKRCADCGNDAIGELKPWALWPGRYICRDTAACRERQGLSVKLGHRIDPVARIKSRKQAWRKTGYPDHPELPE